MNAMKDVLDICNCQMYKHKCNLVQKSQENTKLIKFVALKNMYLSPGRYIENHGVIHNIWFNTTTQEKKQYYMTQFVDEYWDNGSLPIWITAQRQVSKSLTQKL